MADREVCAWRARQERERERGRASERERARERRRGETRQTCSRRRERDEDERFCPVGCKGNLLSGYAVSVVLITGSYSRDSSSILLPSPRDFEISFAPSLEGEFSSPLKREGERNPLPIDRYFATMPRHGSPLPSLPPLSFACRYYERKQTGNWFDRRLFFFFSIGR